MEFGVECGLTANTELNVTSITGPPDYMGVNGPFTTGPSTVWTFSGTLQTSGVVSIGAARMTGSAPAMNAGGSVTLGPGSSVKGQFFGPGNFTLIDAVIAGTLRPYDAGLKGSVYPLNNQSRIEVEAARSFRIYANTQLNNVSISM